MPTYFKDAICERQTDLALQVTIVGMDEPRWIPKSVLHDDSEIYDDEDNSEGTLVIANWFADKEQLSDFADDQVDEE